ncbi:glycosyltransferase [Sediminicola sp. 1XM1-17]|uniref:glycosyltransferase n=1 Tax=Sediminicola sp. 1XM1-17 TaxID=3127702 RepID=UPI003078075A
MKVKEIPVSIYHTLRLLSKMEGDLKNNDRKEVPVIVSLTSIPSRLQTLHIVIRSLLDQEVVPKKILLWLNDSLKDDIPQKLSKLLSDRFEIRFSELTCSHRKLIHSLELYGNEIIVTCDDDLIYRRNWLKLLYQEHLEYPKQVIANQTRYIRTSSEGEILPYKQWTYPNQGTRNPKAVIPIGAGGVLYPPKALYSEATNKDLFLQLTPKADDLWFKAMSTLQGTLSREASKKADYPIPILGSQKESLKSTNIDKDKNRTQWLAVSEHFKITLD